MSARFFMLALMTLAGACSSSAQKPDGGGGVSGTGGSTAGGGAGGSIGGAGAGGTGAIDGGPNIIQTCVPPSAIDQPAAKLSQTGCMDPSDTKKMAASVVPYDVNSPLWSDGADKQRGMALANGAKIHVKDCTANASECLGTADEGKWVLPVGTVLVKSFLFDNKFVETRLFVHLDASTWVGYSYKWDEGQTDATIVGMDGDEVMFNTGLRMVDWHYPTRANCMSCHTPFAGSSLGPETAQMNRAVTATSQNQIDHMTALGMFETPPAKPYKAPLTNPLGTDAMEARARSYLHANCGFCHRPDDNNFASIDLRYDTPFKDTFTCGVTPEKGNQGVSNSTILEPGQPSKSVMVLRMMAPPADANGNHGRMPKIASYVVDTNAVSLISQWISAMAPGSCPQ
jgi:uncharacterized repeat protein (TIGR03806 family)